jgi:hypothetical protein
MDLMLRHYAALKEEFVETHVLTEAEVKRLKMLG